MRNGAHTLAVLLAAAHFCLADALWHHPQSPYRAIFQTPPEVAAGGALVEFFLCGLGNPRGTGVFCFSEDGKQLLILPRGLTTKNRALLQVRAKPNSKIYAYFGSQLSAPDANLPPAPLCEIYDFPDGDPQDSWKQIVAKLGKAKLIGRVPLRTLTQVGNPVDSTRKVAAVLSGTLQFPQNVFRGYFLSSVDAGSLFVDGKQLISRTGSNAIWNTLRGENHGQFHLKEGRHEIQAIAVCYDHDLMLSIGEYLTPPQVVFLRESDLVQATPAQFLRYETKARKANCPAFDYNHTAYAEFTADGDYSFTVTTFRAVDDCPLEWEFQDGVHGEGKHFTRLFFSLEKQRLKAHAGKNTATGEVSFPQAPPPRALSINNAAHWTELHNLMKDQIVQCKSPASLYAALQFYLLSDLHPMQLVVAERFLKYAKNPSLKQMTTATLAIARTAAKEDFQKAADAWERFLELTAQAPAERKSALPELLDFLIFQKKNYSVAEEILDEFLDRNEPDALGWRHDIALLKNRKDNQEKLKEALLGSASLKRRETNAATTRGNAIRASVVQLLRQGNILEAERNLRAWVRESPQARFDGSYVLERARLFRAKGWNNAAALLLQSTVEQENLLPNLPDLQLELLAALQDAGRKEEARILQKQIKKDFPNLRNAPR